MVLNMFQYSLRAVRITVLERPTFFLAHTALMTSYSIALLGSAGRFAGSGEGSSGSGASSDSE